MLSPSKIIGIGSNYRRHIEEMGRSIPAQPKMFLMPPTALIGPGKPLRFHRGPRVLTTRPSSAWSSVGQ